MTLETPLWQQNASFPAVNARRLVGAMWSTGVTGPDELAVTQRAAGPNMSVDVAAGTAIIDGTAGTAQGRYLCHSTAVTNVSIAAAPTTGQSRIDLIVATVRDSEISGTDDDWILQAITGTPSTGSPAEPAVPDSSLVLAAITVAGGAALIGNGAIQNRRVLAGNRADLGSLSVPPAFDGQIMGTAGGLLWVGDDGGWVWANKPFPAVQPIKPLVATDTNTSWSSVVDGAHVLATVNISAQSYAANALIWFQGTSRSTDAASNWTDYWIRTTAGSTTNHQIQSIFTPNNLSPSGVSLVANRYVPASTTFQAQAMLSTISGKATGFGGLLVVQINPA